MGLGPARDRVRGIPTWRGGRLRNHRATSRFAHGAVHVRREAGIGEPLAQRRDLVGELLRPVQVGADHVEVPIAPQDAK